MTLSKLYKMSILFGVFAMFIAFTPAVTMAGGPEPGDSCPGDWKYAAPPYMGDLTVTIEVFGDGEQSVVVTGRLEQVGNPECFANLSQVELGAMTVVEFQKLKPGNLRMTCLENICDLNGENCPFPCLNQDQYLEVVGVGNMKWLSDKSFTAKFIIMPLE